MAIDFDFNPLTGKLDLVNKRQEQQTSSGFIHTKFVSGKITDIEEGYDNIIDCCTLPATSTRQTLDLGTLDELCD